MKRNYFTLLLLEPSFSIDINVLEKNYLSLQKQYHPDRVLNEDKKQKYASISSDLNNAYWVLKNDLSRAHYIMSMTRMDADKIESGKLSEIVKSMFEENEALENFEDKEQIKNFIFEKYEIKKSLLLAMEQAFQDKDFEVFGLNTIKLKYICKMMDQAEQKLITIY